MRTFIRGIALACVLCGTAHAQVRSDIRIPITKELVPTVVPIVHLDTFIFQPRTTVVLTSIETLTLADTLYRFKDDTVAGAAFPAWLALAPVGAFAFALNHGRHHSSIVDTATVSDSTTPPVTATPEPGTIWLLASGLLLLGAIARRRLT